MDDVKCDAVKKLQQLEQFVWHLEKIEKNCTKYVFASKNFKIDCTTQEGKHFKKQNCLQNVQWTWMESGLKSDSTMH